MTSLKSTLIAGWPGVLARAADWPLWGKIRRRSLYAPLFIALYTWVLVSIFYKMLLFSLVLPPLETTRPEARAANAGAVNITASLARAVQERNLFGSVEKTLETETTQKAATAPAATLPPPPRPTLTLELRGTVAGDHRTAFAALRERGKPADSLYRIGDTVAGATLREIRRGEVVVEFNGDLITLRMVSSPLSPLVPERSAVSPPPPPTVATRPSSPSEERITITRAEVANQLSDLGGLLSQAQVRPFLQGGNPQGFIISQIRPGSIYQRMNLRDGDIIQEVNQRRLRGAEDMVEFYNLLKGAPSVAVVILRDGRPETLNYDLR